MKILLANVSTAPKGDPFIREVLVPIWARNLRLTASPDTELVFRFPEWGIIGMEGIFFHSLQTLADQLLFYMCRDAQQEGFDAVMITCFADPYLDQLRQFLDIPVVSIGEASYTAAARMGKRFGVVTISKDNVYETEQKLHEYGLLSRCAGVIPTTETAEEQPAALVDAHRCMEAFAESGRTLIGKGAEALIPGCGLMAPALRLGPGCPAGMTELDGVAVVDVFSAAMQEVESLVRIKTAGSAWISRSGRYRRPTEAALISGQMCLTDDRMSFWDITG